MANLKKGWDYYNVDTNRYQDIKIKRLKKDFGPTGIAVYDYILCEVYRVKGCFLEWDDSTAFDVADYFGIKESLVKEIVGYCGVVGLFNKGLLTRGIITSLSIQSRFREMCLKAKRRVDQIPEICAINSEECVDYSEESTHYSEECTDYSEESTQSKVKKSKVKDREAGKPPKQSGKSLEEREKDFYNALAGYVDRYDKQMIRKFFDYWREPNKSKSKMKFEQERTWDLNLRLQRWAANEEKFDKNFNSQPKQNTLIGELSPMEIEGRRILEQNS